MSKKIFITRSQTSESYFHASLTHAGYEVIGTSLVKFSSLPFIFPKNIDVYFFYSRNGVKHISHRLNEIAEAKFTCMGQGTAEELIQLNIVPDFIGNGNPEITAKLFKEFLGERSVAFVQAKNSKKSIQKILGHSIRQSDLVVYSNKKKKEFDFPNADILVFTSPMNVEAYFERFSFKNEKIIAIGNTTAEKLKKLGIDGFFIAETPSEKSLVQKVLDII